MVQHFIKKNIKTLVSMLCFVFLTGNGYCGSVEAEAPNEMEKEVMELLNAERRKQGLHPFSWDDQLFAASHAHSQDQSDMGRMTHTGSDGSDVSDRALRAGYQWNTIGENVAWNQGSAQEVFNAWMSSKGHRKNMMDLSFCDAAIGYANGNYWTMVLGRKIGVQNCSDDPYQTNGDESGNQKPDDADEDEEGGQESSEPVIDGFFDGTVDQTNIVTFAPGKDDLTAGLNTLIDQVGENSDGGIIRIPDGTYPLGHIKLKSNVHLRISKGAIFKPLSVKGVFGLGTGTPENVPEPVENVKISCENCTKDEKYIIDLRDLHAGDKGKAFKILRASNFWISDFKVVDNRSTTSAVTLSPYLVDKDIPSTPIVDQTVIDSPMKGVIKNATLVNGDEGYGLVQVQAARNIWFEDLHAVDSGVTLRLESGAQIAFVPTPHCREKGQITGIVARNISSKDGTGCILLSPHGRINGSVDMSALSTDGSIFALKVGKGFYDKGIRKKDNRDREMMARGKGIRSSDPILYAKGWFEGPVKVRNIKMVKGNVENVLSQRGDKDPVAGILAIGLTAEMIDYPPEKLHAEGRFIFEFNETITASGYSQCLADKNFIIYADEKKDCEGDFAGDVNVSGE